MKSWQPSAEIAVLRSRAKLLAQVRNFFAQRNVVEVQTPLLGRATVTDPDVAGITVPGYGYLQTSPEYFMKRLLAAGMGDCYQLAAAFRHEERGRIHNSEFTLLEWYRLDYDHHQLMGEVSQLCDLLLGPAGYEQVTYAQLVGVLDGPREELDLRFARACEGLSPGRFFVVDYPAEQAVLAQLAPDNPAVAARFELVIDGVEIANGYWELTDPLEHRRRFAQDIARRSSRNLPQPAFDEQFLAALDAGLPSCAGVAMGVDRLVMQALGLDQLDAVVAFRD